MTSGIRQVTQSEGEQDWWAAGLRAHPKVCCSFQLIVSLWEWHQIAWGKQEIWNLSAISHLKHRWANAASLALKQASRCGSAGIESTCNMGDPGFDPWVGKIPWRRERLPTPVFWPGEFHGLYSPWGPKESDTTERFSLHFTFTIKSLCYCCYCLVAKLCPTLCHPMDCSTPGFPVLYYLLEFAQILVHWVGDAIHPSHPLSSPSPPTFNLSQHQGLLQWVGSLHQVVRCWSLYVMILCM